MKIIQISATTLIPYERNARTHSEEQIEQIAASIKQFGWTNPILVRPDKTVIAGHGRLEAAKKIGMEKVPCIVLENLSEEQCRALVIADNKLALNAGWDMDLLTSELAELKTLDFDLDVIGFSDEELEEMLQKISSDDYGTDFKLKNGDKKGFRQITFVFAEKQIELIESVIKKVKNTDYTFGNPNAKGNAIYEVVRQWAELKK